MGSQLAPQAISNAQVSDERKILDTLFEYSRSSIPAPLIPGISYSLLKRFGTLQAVLHAPHSELQKMVGGQKRLFQLLEIIKTVSQATSKPVQRNVLQFESMAMVKEYAHRTMAHEPVEQTRILYLNKRNHLILDEVAWTGTVDHTPVYTREIMKRALELGATALFLVHNHPSGDPTPSQADILITRQVESVARMMEIELHDHLIVGKHGQRSLREMKYMSQGFGF